MREPRATHLRRSALLSATVAGWLGASALPTNAGSYLPLSDSSYSLSFVDLGSLKSVRTERWVWLVAVAKQAPSGLPDGADVVALNIRFDCARGQMQIVGSNRFRIDRTPIQLDTTPTDTAPVPPGTAFSRMMDASCENKFRKEDVLRSPKDSTMFDLSASVKRALAK